MDIITRIKKRLSKIVSSSYKLAKASTLRSYSKMNQEKCEYIPIEGDRVTMMAPKYYIDESPKNQYKHELPQGYMAIINNASIIGGSGVVLTQDGFVLHDALAHPDDDNINITDSGLFMLFGEPHKLFGKYIICHKRHTITFIEKGISLVWNMSSNYYHFTMEAAAKMYFVEMARIDKTVPLIVDQRSLNYPQMKEVIDALNTDGRKIIPLESDVLCNVNTLFCLGPVNKVLCNRKYWKRYNPKVEDFGYDPDFISYYKKKVQYFYMRNIRELNEMPERIYLSRRNCHDRKCNEEDILPILTRYGFQVMQTEDMSLSDQFKLFSTARHIVGTSGAAFTNMVFGNADTRYTIITSFRSRNTCYSNLAASVGSKCDFIAGESLYDDSKRVNEHREFFFIDPCIIKDYLEKIYG